MKKVIIIPMSLILLVISLILQIVSLFNSWCQIGSIVVYLSVYDTPLTIIILTLALFSTMKSIIDLLNNKRPYTFLFLSSYYLAFSLFVIPHAKPLMGQQLIVISTIMTILSIFHLKFTNMNIEIVLEIKENQEEVKREKT